jgi:hypothetical protein
MTRAEFGIDVDLLELVERPVAVFARLVMLDEHHGDIECAAWARAGPTPPH